MLKDLFRVYPYERGRLCYDIHHTLAALEMKPNPWTSRQSVLIPLLTSGAASRAQHVLPRTPPSPDTDRDLENAESRNEWPYTCHSYRVSDICTLWTRGSVDIHLYIKSLLEGDNVMEIHIKVKPTFNKRQRMYL